MAKRLTGRMPKFQKENTMKKLLILTAGLFLISGNAFASGSHTGGHDEVKKETHGHDNADGHHDDAMAAQYTKGVVKKINMKSRKVTIIHEELKGLGMPAMTMVFRMADDAMLDKMKVGGKIEFVADRVKGKLTVMELK